MCWRRMFWASDHCLWETTTGKVYYPDYHLVKENDKNMQYNQYNYKSLNWKPDYIIEKEPLVNKFISRQKDKGNVSVLHILNLI